MILNPPSVQNTISQIRVEIGCPGLNDFPYQRRTEYVFSLGTPNCRPHCSPNGSFHVKICLRETFLKNTSDLVNSQQIFIYQK